MRGSVAWRLRRTPADIDDAHGLPNGRPRQVLTALADDQDRRHAEVQPDKLGTSLTRLIPSGVTSRVLARATSSPTVALSLTWGGQLAGVKVRAECLGRRQADHGVFEGEGVPVIAGCVAASVKALDMIEPPAIVEVELTMIEVGSWSRPVLVR